MALLNLENIAVLAISKEVVQGIGHGSPQVIIRLVFAQIISKITGSEVTPFAVITDESTGVKYPLADYELLPKMAIVDADMMMNAPRGLTAASGIDAVTHALEAYASQVLSGRQLMKKLIQIKDAARKMTPGTAEYIFRKIDVQVLSPWICVTARAAYIVAASTTRWFWNADQRDNIANMYFDHAVSFPGGCVIHPPLSQAAYAGVCSIA